MKRISWCVLAAGVLLAAACTSGSGSSDDDDDAATTSTPTPAGTPSFAADIVPIINQRCGTGDNLCHTRVAYGAASGEDCRGWLSLENASLGAEFYSGPDMGMATGCPDRTLYDRLTAAGLADAWECGLPAQTGGEPKVPYVVPGDSAASYLYRKINGGPYCVPTSGGASDPMPIAAPLDATTIEVIRRWIDGGALP